MPSDPHPHSTAKPQSRYQFQEEVLSAQTGDGSGAQQFAYTPFANVLIDQIMPTLSGSEWQLLCVIVRQTQGWFDPNTNARKTRDWLSHRQLKARTGRGSDAVCHAIKSLVHKGHIEVQDEQGRLLATAHERRRVGNRLYYSLSSSLRARFDSQAAKSQLETVPQSRFGKTETTKESWTKVSPQPFGKPKSLPDQASFRSINLQPPQETRFDTNGLASQHINGAEKPESSFADESEPNQAVQTITDAYARSLAKHSSSRINGVVLTRSEANRLQQALEFRSLLELQDLLQVFFSTDLNFVRRHNYSFDAFLDSLHILATLRKKQTPTTTAQEK